MPRPPSARPDSFGAHIRKRRLERGLSAAQLAEQLGVSRSYLSLIENGDRDVGEDLAKALAKIMGEPVKLYLQLAQEESARARGADLDESTLEPLARNELRQPGQTPRQLNVEVKVAKASAVTEQRGRLPKGEPDNPPVPVVPEGTRLEFPPRGDDIEFVQIDPAVVPTGARMMKPFAWKLGAVAGDPPETWRHAADMLRPGDTVVISQDPGEVTEDEIYAIRSRDDKIVLSRVQIKGDVLVLMDPDGKVRDALHAGKASARSFVVGKVAIVIRPMRYAVMRPQTKR